MIRIASIAARTVLAFILIAVTAWGTLALWFRLPLGEIARYGAMSAWLAVACLALYGLIRLRVRPLAPYLAALAALLLWWSTIAPRNDKDWAPDVAHTVTSTIDGNQLHVADVRNFDWRSDTDFTVRWEERSFDLDDLQSLDLINSYWAGPTIAHTILSFGFGDGRHLAISVEVRRQRGEVYSELAGFFKQDELVIIAADERDIVRVRSNVRGENVQLYRLRVPPDKIRQLLLAILAEANELAAQPRFYNTLTANCTTVLFRLGRQIDPALPLDWRIMLTGHLPDYLYRAGLLTEGAPLAQLREQARIDIRANAADNDPDFSRAIRAGVPGW